MSATASVMEIIKRISYRSDFDTNSDLFELGILDSFGTVQLINEIETEFGISISLTELERGDIQTVQAISETIKARTT